MNLRMFAETGGVVATVRPLQSYLVASIWEERGTYFGCR